MRKTFNFKNIGLALLAIVVICGVNIASDYGTVQKLVMRTSESNAIAKASADAYVTADLKEKVSTIHPGGTFFLHNAYHRTEVCYYHVAITLLGNSNHVSIALRDVTNWLPTGDYEFNDLLEAPKSTPYGEYTIRKKLINFCGKDVYYTNLFDLPITVGP